MKPLLEETSEHQPDATTSLPNKAVVHHCSSSSMVLPRESRSSSSSSSSSQPHLSKLSLEGRDETNGRLLAYGDGQGAVNDRESNNVRQADQNKGQSTRKEERESSQCCSNTPMKDDVTATTTTTSENASSQYHHHGDVDHALNKSAQLLLWSLRKDLSWEDRPSLARAAWDQAVATRSLILLRVDEPHTTITTMSPLWPLSANQEEENVQQAVRDGVDAVLCIALNPAHCEPYQQRIKDCLHNILPLQYASQLVSLVDAGSDQTFWIVARGSDDNKAPLQLPTTNEQTKVRHIFGTSKTFWKTKFVEDQAAAATETPPLVVSSDKQSTKGWRKRLARRARKAASCVKSLACCWNKKIKQNELDDQIQTQKPKQGARFLVVRSNRKYQMTVTIDEGCETQEQTGSTNESFDELLNLGNMYTQTNEELQHALWLDKTQDLTNWDGVEMFGQGSKPYSEQAQHAQDEEKIIFDCMLFEPLLFEPSDDESIAIFTPEKEEGEVQERSVKTDPKFLHVTPSPPNKLATISRDKLCHEGAVEKGGRPRCVSAPNNEDADAVWSSTPISPKCFVSDFDDTDDDSGTEPEEVSKGINDDDDDNIDEDGLSAGNSDAFQDLVDIYDDFTCIPYQFSDDEDDALPTKRWKYTGKGCLKYPIDSNTCGSIEHNADTADGLRNLIDVEEYERLFHRTDYDREDDDDESVKESFEDEYHVEEEKDCDRGRSRYRLLPRILPTIIDDEDLHGPSEEEIISRSTPYKPNSSKFICARQPAQSSLIHETRMDETRELVETESLKVWVGVTAEDSRE